MPKPVCPPLNNLRIKCVNTNEGVNGLTIEELGILITPFLGSGTSLKLVASMDDFPPAVAGVRTLELNTNYFIINSGLTTSDRFEWTGGVVSFTGLWSVGPPHIIYTGTGNMFTAINGGMDAFRLTFDTPNGNFFLGQSAPPTPLTGLKMSGVTVLTCQNIAEIDGGAMSVNDGACISCVNGFIGKTIANFIFSLRQFNMVDVSGIGVDLQNSVWNTVEMRDVVIRTTTAATGINGLANSGNIIANESALVDACEFGSGVTALNGITVDDIRWLFLSTIGIPNTSTRALNSLLNNAAPTLIAMINTFVPVVGSWNLVNNSQIIQGAANTSQLIYQPELPRQVAIDVTITALSASGNPVVEFQIFTNGNPNVGAQLTMELSNTVQRSGSITWLGQGDLNDTFELEVQNTTGTQNVTVTDATARVVQG